MRGFTLLEVMIALAIMAGVLVTVITSFNYHVGIAVRDKEETVAMLLARSRLDEASLRKEKAGKGDFAPNRPDITWEIAVEPTQWPGVERLNLTVAWDKGQKKMPLALYREKVL